MPNLRIVTKNALRQASSFTASSTAGSLAVSNLAAAVKSTLHRFTGTNGSYRATWAAPARIGCVALPFCNWSPTAKQRVRVSREKSATNILKFSESFVNPRWRTDPDGGTVAENVDFAPDGSFTANKLVVTLRPTSAVSYRYASGTPLDAKKYTFSVFVKKAAAWPWVFLQIHSTHRVGFNLDTKAFVTSAAGTPVTAKLAWEGNGWCRIAITTTLDAAVSAVVAFGLSNNVGGLATTTTAFGAGEGHLFWGAMLNEGELSSYYPSQDTFTSRGSIGTYIGSDGLIKTAAANEARMQYDPANPLAPAKLLLEPAATNYCKGSESLTVAHGWSGPVGTDSDVTYKGVPYRKLTKVLATQYEYCRGPTFSRTAGTAQTLTLALRAGTVDNVTVGLYTSGGPIWGNTGESVASIISGPGNLYGSTTRDIVGLSATEDTVLQITRFYTGTAADAGVLIYPGRSSSTNVGDSVLATRVQVEDANVAYGPELVTNGTFAQDTTGWTALGGATLTVDSGRIVVTNSSAGGQGGAASQAISTVVGKVYRVSADFTKSGTAKGNIAVSNTQGKDDIGKATSTVTGKLEFTFAATATTTHLMVYPNATDASISGSYDNISVQEGAGVDLVTNGSFASATGWSPVGSGVAVNTSTGKLVFSSAPANSQMYQNMGAQLVQGKQYEPPRIL